MMPHIPTSSLLSTLLCELINRQPGGTVNGVTEPSVVHTLIARLLTLRKLLLELADDLAKRAQLIGNLIALLHDSTAVRYRRILQGEFEDAIAQLVAFDIQCQRICAQVGERIVHTLVEHLGRPGSR